MKIETFRIETITPCFCGGAEPDKQAEIRAPSIRGQLRWWFRTLGGFESLNRKGMGVRDQEAMIFGSIRDDSGTASLLTVRVSGLAPSKDVVDDNGMDARPGSDRGYLLFPLRGKPRAVFNPAAATGKSAPAFNLQLMWRGHADLWPDLRALVSVLANLGALGFRSRRAMGALACQSEIPTLADSLKRFADPASVKISFLAARNAPDSISVLARWLKSWRSYGRTGKNDVEKTSLGFPYAKNDHDIAASRAPGPAFRPALGLPILSKYGEWSESPAKGRFASPVLLRPHRDRTGAWHALIIFVDAHRWPENKAVYLHGQKRAVSTELYQAMKADSRLQEYRG